MTSLMNDKVLGVAPFKFKITTINLQNMKQKGYYAVSYLLNYHHKIMMNQTGFVYYDGNITTKALDGKGSVFWNEEMEFQLPTTTLTLNWSLLHKLQEDNCVPTTLESGSVVLNSLPMQQMLTRMLATGGGSSGVSNNNLSVTIQMTLTRNDSALKVLTRQQYQARQAVRNHQTSGNKVNNTDSNDSDNMFFTSKKQYGAIYITFQEIMNQTYFPYLSTEWCKDCIQDTNHLVETFVTREIDGDPDHPRLSLQEELEEQGMMLEKSKRPYLKLFNGSKIYFSKFSSNFYHKHEHHHSNNFDDVEQLRSFPVEEEYSVLLIIREIRDQKERNEFKNVLTGTEQDEKEKELEEEEIEVPFVLISFTNRYLLWNFIKWFQYAMNYWPMISKHPSFIIASTSSKESFQSWMDIITPPVWIIEENMMYETDVKIYFYENQSHYHGKMKLDLTKFFTLLLTKENYNSNNNVSSNNISTNDIPDIISLQSVCAMVLSSDAMNAEESMIQIEAQHCELIRGKRIVPLSDEKSLRSSPITTTSGPSIIDPKATNEKNTKGFLGGLFSSSYQTVKSTTAGVLSNTVGTLYPSKDSNHHHQDRIIIKCEGKDYALTYDPSSHEWVGKMFIENSFSQNLFRRSAAYHQSEGGFSLARKKKGMRDIMARKEKIDSNQVILGYCTTTINSGVTLLLQKGSSSNDIFLHSSNKESTHSPSLGTGIIGQKYLPLHRLYPLISIDSDAKTPRFASDYLQDNINYRENEVLIEFNTKLGFSITLLTSEHPSSIIHQYDEKVYGLVAKCKFVDRDGVSIASSLSSNTIPLTPSKGKGRHQKKKKSSFFGSVGKSSQVSDEGDEDIELNWNNFNFILSTFHGLEKAEYVRIELIVVLYANRYLKKDSLGGIFIPIGFFRGSSQTATIPIIPFRKQGLPSPFNEVRENSSFSKRNFDGRMTNTGGESGFLYGEWCYGDVTVEIKRIEEPLDQNQTFIPAVSLKISSELAPISGTWWMTEALLKGTIQTLQHSSQGSSAPLTSNNVMNDIDINPQHVTTCWIHLGYNELLIDVSEAILARDHINRKNPQMYRSQMNKEYKNHILLTCEELHLEKMMVILPYDQILSAAAVTSSVLSMELNIGRYFDSIVSPSSKGKENENTAGGVYRRTTIVCYVSNCPARNLYQYIEDRKFFALIRFQLYQILHETRQVHHQLPSETKQSQEEKDANNQLLSSTIHLFIEMNNISSMLETRLQRLFFAPFEKTATPLLHSYDRLYEYRDRDESEEGINTEYNEEEERIEEMISELGGRICRLRLYTSILFGLNITCSHQFETSSIHAMVDQDIQFMKENILLPPSPPNEPENAQTAAQPESASTSIANEISRMNEGIDYLLEICEHRLIETMICGWNLTNTNQLFLSLEIMINRYFIEIIALLSRYFEDSEQTIIQGISNKMEIIHSYLKYHNKLAIIIQRLLLPYGIVISPLPTISLFLDFSVLISWYMSSLVTEMRKRVDNVIAVWKDRSKDVTGEGNYYTSVDIPWIPQRISVSALLDRDDNNNEEESDTEGSKAVGGETTKTISTVDTDDASTTMSSTRKRKNLKAMKALSNVEYFLTNIPEDILMILNSYLQYTRIHLNDHRQSQQSSTRKEKGGENTEDDDNEGELLNHELLQLLEELNHKIYISYFHSLLYLIHEYYEKELLILISNFYRNHSSSSTATGNSSDSFENEQTEYIIWMCSVVNDCYRMMNYPYIDHLLDSYSSVVAGEEGITSTSSSSKEKKGGISNNEEEEGKKRKEKLKKYLEEKYHNQIEEVIQGFKRVYQTAIHQISCYIFHSIFLEEHLLYQDNFFTAWYHGIYEKEREKDKGRVTPASPPDEIKERDKEKEKDGFSTKRRGSGTNSIGKMDLMKLLTQDLCQFLEEIIYYFMYSDCQIYLIEICIDKMMIIFYYLLRNARNHHLLFHESSHHPLLNYLINDFHYYQSSILQFSHQVYSVMSSIAASTTNGNSSISSTMITSSSDKILLNEDIIVKRLTKHMKLLDNCLQLIDEEIMSNHFITIIKELYDECMNNLKHSFSLFKLLIICLALKGIKECYPKKFHLLNIIPNNNSSNSNNNAASNVLGSVKTPSPPTPPPNSEERRSESKDTTTAANTNTGNPASTPVVISDGSSKPPRIIHFPIYHRIESAIKGHLHSDSSKPPPNTTATITSSTSNSRSVSKDEPNDLQPRLSAEEVNLMYQETFTKEVENLKNQIGYDWILSILNDIQQHHHQFNLIIDKNSHLTITDIYLKLVQSITTNEEGGGGNNNHVLVLKEYELLQQLTLDDFTPECFIFGIIKKHKYSLKQLLLTTIPIYLQYQTTDKIPSLASSSLLSSFTSQLEEETSGKFSTVIGGGGGGSGGSGVINPLHAFQLWRKRMRKKLLHHNNPFTNTNKSDNSDMIINPFHPNHYKVSLFKSKGFHPKKLLSSNNSQQGNNNMMMMSSLFNHKKLTISNIQIIGVISFLQLIPSTLYLQFQLNDMIIKTKPKSQYYNNNNNNTTATNSSMNNDQSSHSTSDQAFLPPHREHSHHNHHHHSMMSDGGCIFDETIELPITLPHSVVEGDLSDQKMTLKISLFNSGYLMHQLLATTSIEFFLISPPNFRNKMIEFDEWIKTFRIHQIPGMLSSSSSSIEGGSGKSHYSSGKVPRLKLSIETLE